MIINIAEIISTAFISKTYNAHLDSETFVLRGTRFVFENKDPIKLKISNIGEQEVSLEADIHVVLDIPCDRCLEAVHVPQCDKDSTDPRMSAIQDIFNNFKEV